MKKRNPIAGKRNPIARARHNGRLNTKIHRKRKDAQRAEELDALAREARAGHDPEAGDPDQD